MLYSLKIIRISTSANRNHNSNLIHRREEKISNHRKIKEEEIKRTSLFDRIEFHGI